MLPRKLPVALACTLCFSLVSPLPAQDAPASPVQTIPAADAAVEARVSKLLSQMTPEEKLSLIHGTQEPAGEYQGQAGFLRGVPRLGIPGLRFADGPPGVLTRHPSSAETATMGVAATFSVRDAEQNGIVIGREARALGIDVSLQPFVNIDRDLTFERAYNTFGEDALLTSRIGAAEIRGIQSQHVMAQVKHFVGYDSNSPSTYIDDQTLHEIYVAPFEAASEAGVASAMCSYNRINGTFACGNKSTLTTILRDQVGFKGFLTSDWGAVHAVDFINAGLDMEMPGEIPPDSPISLPSYFDLQPVQPSQPAAPAVAALPDDVEAMFGGHIPEEPAKAPSNPGDFRKVLSPVKITEALKTGEVSQATVDRAAGDVLRQIIRFGYMDGQQKHNVSGQQFEANARIIEKTGEDAAVLLKNDGAALPLKDLGTTVFIGPTAAQVDAIGINGERSVGLPARQVGPVRAVETLANNGQVKLAVADNMTGETIPAALLTHDGKPGVQRTGGSGEQTDALVSDVLGRFGKIGILILCAGMIANTPIADATDDEWESIWRVNVMGVVNPLRRIFPLMCAQGHGKIVALGSIAAKIGGVASGPAYVAAKSAVHGIMKWSAKAGAGMGVYANIVAPGPVETPMWQNVTGRAPPSAHGSVPLGRFGQPEDIAQAILFLCSPASNWITGTTLDVNGGMLMD